MSSYKDRVMKRLPDRPKTGIRAKASGLVGRNKDADSSHTTVARPISELRDPASFAPPPKRTGTGLEPPPPPPSKKTPRKVVMAPSKYQDPRAPAQLEDSDTQDGPTQLLLEDTPSLPARNKTNLQTNHLPLPPARRDGANGKTPPPYEKTAVSARAPPPSLPPRLPPRGGGDSPPANNQQSAGNGMLNQGAVGRLSAAGVSVPGFGIGQPSKNSGSSPSPPPPPRTGGGSKAQVNELQNRFAKLNTASPTADPPREGTTWEQKQAALKTASAFNKDPSSVSLADAKAAAGTANNFRQRHGDQVAAGVQSANNINQKYGVASKVGGYAGQFNQSGPAEDNVGGGQAAPAPAIPGLAGKKKPPPPPPKKKPALLGSGSIKSGGGNDEPPPIPMSTRPNF